MSNCILDQNATTRVHSVQAVRRVKVLMATGALVRGGGVTVWLMNVLRRMDAHRFAIDLVVDTSVDGEFDEEVRSLGFRIIKCPDELRRPWRFARRFKAVLESNGPYDIFHTHRDSTDGFLIKWAAEVGVPVRISHSHNDLRSLEFGRSPIYRAYSRYKRSLVRRRMTGGVACSADAASCQFGEAWSSNKSVSIMKYGIDLEPFKTNIDRLRARKQFGIDEDALVIGHVGRFVDQKNHVFLINVMKQLVEKVPSARLLLVGAGHLEHEIRNLVDTLSLSNRVHFAGIRSDIAFLMRNVMDVFVFPSRHEGLGLVLLEAQAAGLPAIASDGVPTDATVIAELVRRCSLSDPYERWVEAILDVRGAHRPDNGGCLAAVAREHDGRNSAKLLQDFYLRNLEDLRII